MKTSVFSLKSKSKISLFVTALSVLTMILALALPSLIIPQNGTVVMGFTTTFGGTIKYLSGTTHIGFPTSLFIAWILVFVGGAFAFLLGSKERSAYFFSLLCFVASLICYALTLNCISNINVAGGISGFASAELSAAAAQPVTRTHAKSASTAAPISTRFVVFMYDSLVAPVYINTGFIN